MATERKNRINELRSEEVQEILSYIPNWIIRWGITVIFFTLLMILLSSWFIHYPDIINSRIVITTYNPPASIVARSSGRLTKFVNENEMVKKDTELGVIENPADFDDVTKLKNELESFRAAMDTSETIPADSMLNENLKLGELQTDYLNFLKTVKDYRIFSELNFYGRQIAALQLQIEYYNKLNESLQKQEWLLKQEFALSQKKYSADSVLAKQEVLAPLDFDKSETTFLQKKQALESSKANIINNRIQVADFEKRINELQLQQQDNRNKLLMALEDAYKKLQAQFASWEQQYVLKSPMDGKVSFFKYRSDNQYVNANEEVMTIVSGSQEIYGLVTMPLLGSGKVKTGQKVNIKFDNYPNTEYGIVKGIVKSISEVPRNNMYSIEVSLPDGLMTSYKKSLEFRQEMQGNAEIVTDDLRLIQRVFNQIRTLIDNLGKK